MTERLRKSSSGTGAELILIELLSALEGIAPKNELVRPNPIEMTYCSKRNEVRVVKDQSGMRPNEQI